MQFFQPENLFIEENVLSLKVTQRIIKNAKSAKIIKLASKEDLPKEIPPRSILLAAQRGPFLRYCPGTPKHICCMYHNLDLAEGCDLGCTYCILQAYLHTPLITIFCNIDDMYTELECTLTTNRNQFYRIGTGELTDSLTFDHLTEMNAELIRYFSNKKNALFELKSKTVNIDQILSIPHNRRTIISWSMNASSVVLKEEERTPPVEDRLAAAREAQKANYWLGFHFDPIIDFPGWEEEYQQVVDKIFTSIHPDNILWISLGALRYPPMLDGIIRQNHPQSGIVLGELLPGLDRKFRYFKAIRIEFFRKMYQWIRHYSADIFVYLCMESDEIWQRSFGWSPKSSRGLKKLLDERVKDKLLHC